MKIVKVRFSDENYQQIEELAKEVLLTPSTWIALKTLEALAPVEPSKRGRPRVNPLQKKMSEYASDVAFFLKQDSGQKCEGSEQLYPRRGSLGKYPSAVCEVCRVEHFGQEIDPGRVQVREHLDGAQTGEEIGFIEPLGTEVMDTRFIGKEREGF